MRRIDDANSELQLYSLCRWTPKERNLQEHATPDFQFTRHTQESATAGLGNECLISAYSLTRRLDILHHSLFTSQLVQ